MHNRAATGYNETETSSDHKDDPRCWLVGGRPRQRDCAWRNAVCESSIYNVIRWIIVRTHQKGPGYPGGWQNTWYKSIVAVARYLH
jgi:hypothetical protein